jgi:hypothetical protein
MDEKQFKERIVLWMACGILAISFGYVFLVTFIPIPETGIKHSDTVTGFLLGTGLGALLSYYWGSSSGSAAKSDTIEKKLEEKPPEPPKP